MKQTLFTRREIVEFFGASGAAMVGVKAENTDTSLLGGADNMSHAYQVGGGLYKGPLSVRSDVPEEDGLTFIQTDAGSDGEIYSLYHYSDGKWVQQGMDLQSVRTSRVNNVPTPPPDKGGSGVLSGLKDSTVVHLHAGTYDVDDVIQVDKDDNGHLTIIGAGPRQTEIKAGSEFVDSNEDDPEDNTSIISGRKDKYDEITLRDLTLNANGKADHCLSLLTNNVRFDIGNCRFYDAKEENIRLRGAFNGRFWRCRSVGGTNAMTIGDNEGARSSDIALHNCHFDKTSGAVVKVATTDIASKSNAGFHFSGRCDFSDGTEGLLLGNHSEQIMLSSISLESNEVGLKLQSNAGNSWLPKDVLVENCSLVNNTTADIKVTHGSNIGLFFSRLKSDVPISSDGMADGPIVEFMMGIDEPSGLDRGDADHRTVDTTSI